MPRPSTATRLGRRRWVIPGLVATLVFAGACGDDDQTVTTTPPAQSQPPASSTTEPPGTTTPVTTPVDDQAAVAVVDEYIAAIAAGDLPSAWDLVHSRSQEALGGYEAFEELRSALSEGIGAWSAAEGRTTHVFTPAEATAVVLLRGTVRLEGPPAPAAQAVPVRAGDAGPRVSPFEGLPGDLSAVFDPAPLTPVQPGSVVRVTVPAGVEVQVAVETDAPTTPDPVGRTDSGTVYEVALPAGPAPDGRTVTVFLAGADGARTAYAGLWPVTDVGTPESAEEVARAFVQAWRDGDDARLAQLGQPAAVEQATALAGEAGRPWAFDRCEGAAGSVYCAWSDAGAELVVRVANIETPRLVSEFRLG